MNFKIKIIFFIIAVIEIFTQMLFAAPSIKITELFFTGTHKDFIELYCLDDDNNGNGADISGWTLWSISTAGTFTLLKTIGDIDNDTATLPVSTIIKPGEFLILNFSAVNINDDIIAKNNVINIYTQKTELATSSTEFMVLLSTDSASKDAAVNTAVDMVVISSDYDYDNSVLETLVNKGEWGSFAKGGSGCTPREYGSWSSSYSVSRYKYNNKLTDSNTYKDWIEIKPANPGSIPKLSDTTATSQINFSIIDTPKDLGGNLTINFTPTKDKNFYRYNVYISEEPCILENTDSPPELVCFNQNCNQLTISKIGGKSIPSNDEHRLLVNNKNYYVLITYTNIYGCENRSVTFSKYAAATAEVTKPMNLLITEIVIKKSTTTTEQMIELSCLDDGNNGLGANLAGYSLGDYSSVKPILVEKVLYKGNKKIFGNSVIKTGDKVILSLNSMNCDDTVSAGSVLKTYQNSSSILSTTTDFLVLYDPFGQPLDAIGFTNGSVSSDKQTILNYLFSFEQWYSNSATSLLNSNYFLTGISATRKKINDSYVDTNSDGDWDIQTKINVGVELSTAADAFGNIKLNNKIVVLDSDDINKRKLTISIDVYQYTILTIRIYDVEGRVIRNIAENESPLLPSTYNYEWNGQGSNNRPVPTGMYILYIDGYNNFSGFHKKYKDTIVVAKKF